MKKVKLFTENSCKTKNTVAVT